MLVTGRFLVSGFQFLELQQQKGKYSDDLKINQHAIADLTRLLNKMQSEHDAVKKQVGKSMPYIISSLDLMTIS